MNTSTHHVRGRARRAGAATIAIALAVTAAACSGGDGSNSNVASPEATGAATDTAAATPAPADTEPADVTEPPADVSAEVAALRDSLNADDSPLPCDIIGVQPDAAAGCMLPFPSDWLTVADDTTATGRRLSMPTLIDNVDGVPIEMAEWNRADGFSPNTPLLAYLPGLDATASKLPTWTDLGASLDADATVVLVNLATGERVPLWAELDVKADDDVDRTLIIRPTVALPEGTTFVVALRDLVGDDGSTIAAQPGFVLYRESVATTHPQFEARRADMEAGFAALDAADVDRSDLQLAWTFTTATADNIAGRMLHIRDAALGTLAAGAAPAFTITEVTNNTDDNIATQVRGTITVPNFLTGDGGPGNGFNYPAGDSGDPDALPTQNGTLEAGFVCNISTATAAGTEPAHLVQYGHGLLGSNDEINAGNVRAFANEHNVVFCATKWAGMSEDDIGNAATTLTDIDNFFTVADRLQQGVLNQIFLGRLMIGDGGLASHPAFQRPNGTPLIDTSELNYDGNSQGAIMGLMLAAVSPDIDRAVLGVAGMNYSLLLSRSVDFDTYESIFQPAYPNDLDRTVILSLLQMLWDRGEGAGYVQHVTSNAYANTDTKDVLIHVALGDWQVTELSAFVQARTMGAAVHRPVTADGRSDEVEPGWNLPSVEYPMTSGSALIIWDSGSDLIPFDNLPPRTSRDSHEDPRADIDVRVQKAAFLFDKTLVNVCGDDACTADARD
jgi:hypothetical protein